MSAPLNTDDLLDWLGRPAAYLKGAAHDLGPARREQLPGADYWSWPAHGVSARIEGSRVKTIYLYAEGVEGFTEFQGELPRGLTFDSDHEQALQHLGHPSAQGAYGPPGQPEAPWLRYDSAEHNLHVGFEAEGRAVRIVSLIAPA